MCMNAIVGGEMMSGCRELVADADATGFHESLQPPIARSVLITNRLPFGVAIWNISLPGRARSAFSVS